MTAVHYLSLLLQALGLSFWGWYVLGVILGLEGCPTVAPVVLGGLLLVVSAELRVWQARPRR